MPDLVLMTVASDFGWSRVFLPYVIRDVWSGLDHFRSINEREILAVTILVHFMSHPGWQTCGYPYGQLGRIFLFKKNGFSSLTSNDGLCQAGFSLFSGIMPFLTMDIKYYHETSGTSIDKELP